MTTQLPEKTVPDLATIMYIDSGQDKEIQDQQLWSKEICHIRLVLCNDQTIPPDMSIFGSVPVIVDYNLPALMNFSMFRVRPDS